MRVRRLRRLVSLLAVPMVAAGLVACGGGDEGGRDAAGLTLYSGRNEQLIGPLLERFTSETGIKVNAKYGDSAELALTLDKEGERTPGQVYLSQSPGAMGFVAGKGLLGTIPADTLGKVPADRRATDGSWTGLTARVRVLVVNTDKVPEAERPASVFDLQDPKWKGRVGLAPTNGSFQDFVSAMRQSEGDERTEQFLAALKANDAKAYGDNNAIVEAVSRGEIDAGLVNHYYVARFLSEDPSLKVAAHFFRNDPGSVALFSTVGILKDAVDDEAARRFVAFLVSEESQKYFVDETYEYPLAEGVGEPANTPPFSSLQLGPVDLAELGEEFSTTLDMIRSSGLAE